MKNFHRYDTLFLNKPALRYRLPITDFAGSEVHTAASTIRRKRCRFVHPAAVPAFNPAVSVRVNDLRFLLIKLLRKRLPKRFFSLFFLRAAAGLFLLVNQFFHRALPLTFRILRSADRQRLRSFWPLLLLALWTLKQLFHLLFSPYFFLLYLALKLAFFSIHTEQPAARFDRAAVRTR